MKIHLIAIGGSAMHNIALALKDNGHDVQGSDDQIFEPSKSRLKAKDLLPKYEGWNPDEITTDLDAVILGMHAKPDNPELKKAQDLNIPIYSYPEFIYEHSKDKKRIVIGGSHGKTTTTSMILHVLNFYQMQFDYLVGAQLHGFENMVKLSDAPIIIIEGDEYLSSPIDRRPKFHLYQHDVGLITGIAWDHINVFPTFENYKEQFEKFIALTPKNGKLIYFEEDEVLSGLVDKYKEVNTLSYRTPESTPSGNGSMVLDNGKSYKLSIFGAHNLQNMYGAKAICETIGIGASQFFEAIASFTGADKRLQLLQEKNDVRVYKDFAHSPSKLKASVKAVKSQFPGHSLIACVELHTFSSLTKEFLSEYDSSMNEADQAYVYFNPDTIKRKNLAPISKSDVQNAFGRTDIKVFNDSNQLIQELKINKLINSNFLIMTSGNFDGVNIEELAMELVKS
ncbi:MAG: Mur ligase family protein [Flavobacteriales bacterium]|nr:Mur ligase family protein [Flavobacteriales bacterium]